MKKFLLALLCALTAFGCTLGASACAVSVTPNGNGGFDITPTTSSSSTTNSSEKEDDSSSSTGESSGGQECSHAWDGGVIVTPATCEAAGQKKWTCILCGDKRTQEINALGHSYGEWTESKKATCESKGEEKRVCTHDSTHVETRETPVLGHEYGEWTESVKATCTEKGEEKRVCANDATHVETRETPALGHSYGEWTESEGATCDGDGEEKRVCANDSTHVEWRDGASAHGHEFGEWVESKKATCENKGEEKRVCIYDATHVETRETPALGHEYGAWTESVKATCMEKGEEKRVCANDSTHKETRETPTLGHEYGAWTESKKATCESKGEEKRVCANDSTHVETRETLVLGHKYGEWVEVSASTCAKEGVEERVCANDSTHKETRALPKTDEHNVLEDGTCSVCKKTIKNRLATPVIKSASDTNVTWDIVPNVDYYLVYVLPANEYVDVRMPTISLEGYFAGNKQLEIYVQAIAKEDGDYVNSVWSNVYTFVIQGVTTDGVKGVGDSVNLLKGGYTDYADGATRIFDQTAFSRLRLMEDTSVKGQTTSVTYQEGLESYLSKLTENYNTKINYSASAGMDKVAKVTAGYNFSVGTNYTAKNFSETTAVFYDMDFYHINKKLSIDGYNDSAKLSAALSEAFLRDAKKVNNGAMGAEEFINLYGTHVVTSGLYGATFNAHYELLTSKTEAETAFGSDVQYGISSQLKASMYGIDVDVNAGASTNVKFDCFTSTTNANKQTSFSITAKGGDPTGVNGVSLEAFSSACSAWANSLTDENCVLIDVPDNSLFFVWDYLGDEYTAAKEALNAHFFEKCDESYYALKDKIGSIYRESMLFDAERGILTVDFAGLNTFESADLSGVAYDGWYNKSTGVFTVYSAYNSQPIEKVIFKGSYNKKDNLGRTITTQFENFAIKFDGGWASDILLELNSFAYVAPSGCIALDFSEVQSENITINVVGSSSIKGGDGVSAGDDGLPGIDAINKNLTVTGEGELTVVGGNGVKGASTGVDGESKGDAPDRTYGYRGDDGKSGSNGGNGAGALYCNNITLMSGTITLTGGNGGEGTNGGNGGHGGKGGDHGMPGGGGGNGGNGGNGGSGGDSIVGQNVRILGGKMVLNGGNTGTCGSGGRGGDGGRGGWQTGIASYKSGNGGNGGNGGDGGYAGSAGNSNISSLNISYKDSAALTITEGTQAIRGYYGYGGSGGKYGSTDMWAGNGSWGADGANGSGSTPI